MKVGDVLYRYQENLRRIGGFDELDCWLDLGLKVELELLEFIVDKETAKGFWLKNTNALWSNWQRWVKKGNSKYAQESKEKALRSFIQRKRRHIGFLEEKLKAANEALNQAEYMLEKGE